MSSRAIRAIRGDNALLPLESQDSSDDEDESQQNRTGKTFASIAFEDDDDSSCDASESDDEKEMSDKNIEAKEEEIQRNLDASLEPSIPEEEEDLDALISEFQQHDTMEGAQRKQAAVANSPFSIILRGTDIRDMDIEWSLRVALLDGANETSAAQAPTTQRQRRIVLFGPARDGWPSPPRYVGGGIGMKTYVELDSKHVPWPYSEVSADNSMFAPSRWFQFTHSDTYQQDCTDYEVVQNTGDFNTLVWFVIHHPFNCQALLQLSSVLYQTNHSNEGLALLRRCLWVYESSALHSFVRDHMNGYMGFMDATVRENQTFFAAMFKLFQVANIAGYVSWEIVNAKLAHLVISPFLTCSLVSLDCIRQHSPFVN
jgi:hypothetical protein